MNPFMYGFLDELEKAGASRLGHFGRGYKGEPQSYGSEILPPSSKGSVRAHKLGKILGKTKRFVIGGK